MCRSQFACSTWSQLQGQTELQRVVPVTRTPVSYLTDVGAPFGENAAASQYMLHRTCNRAASMPHSANRPQYRGGRRAVKPSRPLSLDYEGSTYSWVLIAAQCDHLFGATSDSHVYLLSEFILISTFA